VCTVRESAQPYGFLALVSLHTPAHQLTRPPRISRLHHLKRAIKASTSTQELQKSGEHVQQQLAQVFGVPLGNVSSWPGMKNTIDCLRGSNMMLPIGLTPELIASVDVRVVVVSLLRAPSHWVDWHSSWWWQYYAGQEAAWKFGTKELVRLSVGRFFDEMVAHMTQVAAGQLPYRFMLYSGHDNTLLPLL